MSCIEHSKYRPAGDDRLSAIPGMRAATKRRERWYCGKVYCRVTVVTARLDAFMAKTALSRLSSKRLAGSRSAPCHFTSVTGALARWITLVATDPSTMPVTAPRPRVPMMM